MAEKITLFELDINLDNAVKATQKQQQEVDELKAEIKDLTEAYGKNSEAVIGRTAELKNAQKQLRQNQRVTQDLIAVQDDQEGSINQLKKQLALTTAEWAKLSKEERENTDRGKELTKQKLVLTETLKAEEKATGDTRRNVGNYSEGIKEAAGNLGIFGKASGTAVEGVKGIGVASKAVLGPIGLIVAIIGVFVKAIQRNEKAVASINKVFAIFKGAVDGLLNALQPLVENIGDKLVAFFENPLESIKNFGRLIKQNIINRVEGLLELFPALGKSIQLLFKGEFKEAGKIAANALGKVTLGVEDITGKVGNAIDNVKAFGKSVVDEANKAIDANKRLANSQRELLRIQKEFELQQLESQKLAERQRQIRDDEAKNIEERIAANEKLSQILDNQLKKELNLANRQLEFAELRRIADGNTLEVEEEIFDARIKIAEITERIEGQRSEQLTNRNSLLKEQRDLEQAIIDENLEKQRLAAEESARILEEELANRQEILDKSKEARALELEAEFVAASDNIAKTLELEREALEQRRLQEIDFAQRIGADVNLINQKFTQANIELARTEQDAKLAVLASVAQSTAQLFGEQAAAGKAAAIAQTTISTYLGATQAFSAASVFPPPAGQIIGAAAAGLVIANGLLNVKKILSVDSGLPGGNKGATPSISGGGGGASPRAVNINPEIGQGIVSRDNLQNEAITESIGGVELRPTLVEDDVTNKQKQTTDNENTAVI